MEALAAIGLVGNIVQFVDFGGELIAKSVQLYRSYDGALPENVDIDVVTKHLAVLIKKLEDDAILVGDGALQNLSRSCKKAADDLLAALNTVKVKNTQQKWESIRKALRSVWSKEKIRELERRLAKFKEELNLHVVVQLRYVVSRYAAHFLTLTNMQRREQVSQFKREHSNAFEKLDLTAKHILDAIVDQQDVFQAAREAHEAQLTLAKTLHEDTMRKIDDTGQEIIREIKVTLPPAPSPVQS